MPERAARRPRILAFAGSTREGSYNKRLIRVAAEAARAAGADVTLIDLRDYPLPHYDGDAEGEEGLPAAAVALKELFKAHDGLLISTPEYNGGISGMLKNTLDWVSRRGDDDRPRAAFGGKVAGLMAASSGAFGGVHGLAQLRHVLTSMGVLVVPQGRGITAAHTAFDDEGRLKDAAQQAAIEAIAQRLVDLVRRHAD
ncbi:MAG TPA: NAD(P)H-dependent oxidoreductase [Geminicoccaceae bacterium]|nr:NAD(P)H-dependent oxidoreductase [Geminicoccaceae bacterium]